MVQGDLFQEGSKAWGNDAQSSSFFSAKQWAMSLDKIILVFLAAVVLFVLTYSFGFERGKRSMEEKIKSLTAQIETLPPIFEPLSSPAPKPETLPLQPLTAPQMATVESAAGQAALPIVPESAISGGESVVEASVLSVKSAISGGGRYTIQVATALQRDLAEKELQKLVKKGFDPFLVTRGRFIEICVGSFDTVANAKSLLSRLRTEGPYFDAFVRPRPPSPG